MIKCGICHDWCSRIDITKQWWKIAKADWAALNGKDLPYFIAILAVLRETTKEIFDNKLPTSRKHSEMIEDSRGYHLSANKNCIFVPLTETQKKKWRELCRTIRIFRNGVAHISYIRCMNPVPYNQLKDPENSSQDYYRYAPLPDFGKYNESDFKKIHEFIRKTILIDVRSSKSDIPFHRIKYEFYHVERGIFIDFLHVNMIELLKEVKSW